MKTFTVWFETPAWFIERKIEATNAFQAVFNMAEQLLKENLTYAGKIPESTEIHVKEVE